VIPADDKWYTRLAIASIIHQTLDALTIEYPVLPKDQIAALQEARKRLSAEVKKV
jgi:hypothetical protein